MNRKLFFAAAFSAMVLLLFSVCSQKVGNPTQSGSDSAGIIVGVVKDMEGEPIPSVAIYTVDGYGAITDTLGQFIISGIEAGEYDFNYIRFGYKDTVDSGITVEFDRGDSVQMEMRMRKATATVKGNISAGSSKRGASGLAGIGVGIPEQGLFTLTDDNGGFTLSGIYPGAKMIIAGADGAGWGTEEIDFTADSVLSGVSIILQSAGGGIVGQVLDSDSLPRSGAVVKALGGGYCDTTDSDGYYQLSDVPIAVPVEVVSDSNARLCGLNVNEGCQLVGADLPVMASSFNGNVRIGASQYYIPDTTGVLKIHANILGGSDEIALFLWDTDADDVFDKATSSPVIDIAYAGVSAKEIGYSVVTASAETVSTAKINIQPVGRDAQMRVATVDTIQPNEAVNFADYTICLWGGVCYYQWDFNGNGIYDWTSPTQGSVTRIFTQEGTFSPSFHITTSEGGEDTSSFTFVVAGDPVTVGSGILLPPEVIHPTDTIAPATIRLVWTSSGPDAEYEIYFNAFSPPETMLVSGITDTFYTITGVSPDTTYFTLVRAKSGDDSVSSLYKIVSVGENHPPSFRQQSYGPTAGDSVSGDSVVLAWGSQDEDSHTVVYDLYFGTGDSMVLYQDSLLDSTQKVCPDGGFTDNTVYYWFILAYDEVDTVISDTLSFRYLRYLNNNAPVFSSGQSDMDSYVEVGSSYLDTVHASDEDGDGLAYSIIRDDTTMRLTDTVITWTPGPEDVGSNSVSVIITDNKGGADTLSWSITVNDPAPSATSVTSPSSASIDTNSIPVSWSAVSIPDFVSYRVYYSTDSGVSTSDSLAATITDEDSTSIDLTGLAAGTDYYIKVYVCDGSNCTESAELQASTKSAYTITAAAGAGGSISLSGSVRIMEGEDTSFTFTPNTGYQIDSVVVNGASVGSPASYTFSSVDSNGTITVYFRLIEYTITASAGDNGSISPSGQVSIAYGTDTTFTMNPAVGFEVEDVLVNGESVGAVSTYLFSGVKGDSTISVTYRVARYSLIASASTYGSISPAGTLTVLHGADTSFTITPDAHCRISDVLVNDSSVGAVGTYEFENVTGDSTIVANFEQITYTVTARCSTAGGTLSPSGDISVVEGDSIVFTMTPNTDCVLYEVVINGRSLRTPPSTYTFRNVYGDSSITAYFNSPPRLTSYGNHYVDYDSTDDSVTINLDTLVLDSTDHDSTLSWTVVIRTIDVSDAIFSVDDIVNRQTTIRRIDDHYYGYGLDTVIFTVQDNKGLSVSDTVMWGIAGFRQVHYASDFNIFDITFPTNDTGFAVGGVGSYIVRTVDHGSTWTEQTAPANASLEAVYFTDHLHGWAVGSSIIGQGFTPGIYYTTDGGENWNLPDSVENHIMMPVNLYDVHFSSGSNGWAVGASSGYGPILLKTTDGGRNWHDSTNNMGHVDYTSVEFRAVHVFSATEAVAAGTQGWIVRTTDGGATWDSIGSTDERMTDFRDLFFINQNTGWVVGQSGGDGRLSIMKTANGGQNWSLTTDQIDSTCDAVHFINENEGWVTGYDWQGRGFVKRTNDGGQTWVPMRAYSDHYSYPVHGLFVHDNLDAFIAANGGGSIFHYAPQPNDGPQ